MGIPKPANYFFLVPLISFLPWYAMLIAMLATWTAEGRPNYAFMHTHQDTVYISDIGAMGLHPLFIVCSAWQGAGYCFTVACEYFQRSGRWPFSKKRPSKTVADSATNEDEADADSFDDDAKSFETIRWNYTEQLLSQKYLMPPWYTRDERNLIFAAFVLGLLGELALLMCSVFSTAKFHNVHITMVVIFVVLMYISCSCLIAEYFLMGKHYAILHPLAKNTTVNNAKHLRWYQWEGYIWNKFTVSATLKSVWLVLAVLWAIVFAGVSDNSISACFEWLLAFWLGLFFCLMSVDFYMGGRYKQSRYFHQVESFAGYYKYDNLVGSGNSSSAGDTTIKNPVNSDMESTVPNNIRHFTHNNNDTVSDIEIESIV